MDASENLPLTSKNLPENLTYEKMIDSFQSAIFQKYLEIIASWKIGCNSYKSEVSFAPDILKTVCHVIKADLQIMLTRRGALIGKDKDTELPRLSRGKITGVAAFRLSKAHIIHLNTQCINCGKQRYQKGEKPCVVSTLNTEIAISIGIYLINKIYNNIPKSIRRELIYTLTNRHTNQETLGIIFDTFRELC